MPKINSYAVFSPKENLKPFLIERRKLGHDDVLINIEYCGVCHTDIHYAKNDWGVSAYPLVPGHEIIGRIIEFGEKTTGFSVNQLVGVGCLIDSCQSCSSCKLNMEQYCSNGATFTYNGLDKVLGGRTFGGYSQKIVVNKKFVLKISENLDAKAVAPLLCAGITTYSPLKKWKIKKGDKVGVIGLGGLGHMAVKFALAMGADVFVITSSTKKKKDAKLLGITNILISNNREHMQKNTNSFDFLLNTIPVAHDINGYINLLKNDSTMVIVGAIEPLSNINTRGLIFGRKSIAGSLIGGINETQEMLDFCAKHNIVSDVELIDIKYINKAFERIKISDVKYRFVIDMKTLNNI